MSVCPETLSPTALALLVSHLFLLNCQSYMQFQCGTRQVLGGLMTLGFVMLELVVFLKSQAAPAGREFRFPGVTPLPTSINSK